MGSDEKKETTTLCSSCECLAPLLCSLVTGCLVVALLVYFETVQSIIFAGIIGSCAACAIIFVWLQGSSTRARDIKVRTLFRRTSETYSRLKKSLREKAPGKRNDGQGSGSSAAGTLAAVDVGALAGAAIQAVQRGDAKAIERWISTNGVDNRDPGSGSTLLHFAALEDQSRVARILLKACANPNITDADGNSPLHIAAANGSAIIVKYLCEYGADPYALNKKAGTGERTSPMDLAEEFDNRGCALIMERAVRMQGMKNDGERSSSSSTGTPRHRVTAGSPVPSNV